MRSKESLKYLENILFKDVINDISYTKKIDFIANKLGFSKFKVRNLIMNSNYNISTITMQKLKEHYPVLDINKLF